MKYTLVFYRLRYDQRAMFLIPITMFFWHCKVAHSSQSHARKYHAMSRQGTGLEDHTEHNIIPLASHCIGLYIRIEHVKLRG
jgi:hypothetical protein